MLDQRQRSLFYIAATSPTTHDISAPPPRAASLRASHLVRHHHCLTRQHLQSLQTPASPEFLTGRHLTISPNLRDHTGQFPAHSSRRLRISTTNVVASRGRGSSKAGRIATTTQRCDRLTCQLRRSMPGLRRRSSRQLSRGMPPAPGRPALAEIYTHTDHADGFQTTTERSGRS